MPYSIGAPATSFLPDGWFALFGLAAGVVSSFKIWVCAHHAEMMEMEQAFQLGLRSSQGLSRSSVLSHTLDSMEDTAAAVQTLQTSLRLSHISVDTMRGASDMCFDDDDSTPLMLTSGTPTAAIPAYALRRKLSSSMCAETGDLT